MDVASLRERGSRGESGGDRERKAKCPEWKHASSGYQQARSLACRVRADPLPGSGGQDAQGARELGFSLTVTLGRLISKS
jgi:hypothetical protein